MKRTIYLHGRLKALHPEPIEVEADTVAEALRSLQLIPELQPKDGKPHPVQIDGVSNDIHLFGQGGATEIHVRPRMGGAGGNNALSQILIGVTLIAVSFLIPGGWAIAGAQLSSQVFVAGAMMVLGGALQLFMPQPAAANSSEEKSKYLGASVNTVKMGTRIPILYGAGKIGGHYLSFNNDAKTVGAVDIDGGTQTSVADNDGSTSYDATYGQGAYSSGRWSYELMDLRTLPDLTADQLGPLDPGIIPGIAKGLADTAEPQSILDVIYDGTRTKSYGAVHTTNFTPVVDGDHTFSHSWPETIALQVTRSSDGAVMSPSSGMTYSLANGVTYELRISVVRSAYPLENEPESLVISFLVDFPGSAGPQAIQDVEQTSPDMGLPGREIEIENSVFRKYDEPPLADGITPVRPVFSQPTTGPGNLPVSDWSI